ncbi:hypothetical protein ACT3UA_10250 [Glutamicibacter sp. 363]
MSACQNEEFAARFLSALSIANPTIAAGEIEWVHDFCIDYR